MSGGDPFRFPTPGPFGNPGGGSSRSSSSASAAQAQANEAARRQLESFMNELQRSNPVRFEPVDVLGPEFLKRVARDERMNEIFDAMREKEEEERERLRQDDLLAALDGAGSD
jgi:hypothetical protein